MLNTTLHLDRKGGLEGYLPTAGQEGRIGGLSTYSWTGKEDWRVIYLQLHRKGGLKVIYLQLDRKGRFEGYLPTAGQEGKIRGLSTYS